MTVLEILSALQANVAQLNEDYTSLATSVAVMANDLSWLKRFFWLVVGAAIANFVAVIFYIITHFRNGRANKSK